MTPLVAVCAVHPALHQSGKERSWRFGPRRARFSTKEAKSISPPRDGAFELSGGVSCVRPACLVAPGLGLIVSKGALCLGEAGGSGTSAREFLPELVFRSSCVSP